MRTPVSVPAFGGGSCVALIDEQRDPLTGAIIGGAIEVHKALGPGLLESAYEECLVVELEGRGLSVERQVEIPIQYKGKILSCGYRADIIVNRAALLELKAVESVLPVHEAQLLTYLKLTKIRVGLLINFNCPYLRDGLIRRVM